SHTEFAGPARRSHRIMIEDLAPDTTYYLEVGVRDEASERDGSVEHRSERLTFVTRPSIDLSIQSPRPATTASRTMTLRLAGAHLVDRAAVLTYSATLERVDEEAPPIAVLFFSSGPGGVERAIDLSGVPDGRYRLVVDASRAADRQAAVVEGLVVDGTPPSVFVGEGGEIVVADERPVFSLVASDAFSGLDPTAVRLTIDGSSARASTVVLGDAVKVHVERRLAPGRHRAAISVAALAGNARETAFLVTVDLSDPSLADARFAFGAGRTAARPGEPVTLHVVVSDDVGVGRLRVGIGAVNSTGWADVALGSDGRGVLRFRVDPGTAHGSYVLPVVVVDRAGNERAATTPTLLVDARPPALRWAGASPAGAGRVDFALQTDEATTGLVRVYREAAPTGASETLVLAAPGTLHEFTFGRLAPGERYEATIDLLDGAGHRATFFSRFETSADLVPPTAVDALVARDGRDGTAVLTWRPARDDVGVAGYQVFREEPREGPVLLAKVVGTRYVDRSTRAEGDYRYRVAAVDVGGNLGRLSAPADVHVTSRPELLFPEVTPRIGGPSTVFTFRVVVRIEGGASPTSVRLLVDGVAREMTRADPAEDCRTGCRYELSTLVGAETAARGPHKYGFTVSDGRSLVSAPSEGAFAGPDVVATFGTAAGTDSVAFLRTVAGPEGLFTVAALAAAAVAAMLHRRDRRDRP
ncbi:MAG: hypothetical protein ACT4PT_10985, partial [Methanobacteriota archaeon]